MPLASQNLLSKLKIPYAGKDQAGIDELANAARTVRKALVNGAYRSPANLPLPAALPGLVAVPGRTMAQTIAMLSVSPWSQFSSAVVDAMTAATETYHAAFKTGNLDALHAAVDGINALIPLDKQPEFLPPADFQILLSAPGTVGWLAQSLEGQRLEALATDPTDTSLLPPMFDAVQADAIFAEDGEEKAVA